MPTKKEWQAWNAVRKDFQDHESEGFTRDMAVFEDHIQKLIEIQAGWSNTRGLDVINWLRKWLATAKAFFGLLP